MQVIPCILSGASGLNCKSRCQFIFHQRIQSKTINHRESSVQNLRVNFADCQQCGSDREKIHIIRPNIVQEKGYIPFQTVEKIIFQQIVMECKDKNKLGKLVKPS